jgi:hypothetical protein
MRCDSAQLASDAHGYLSPCAADRRRARLHRCAPTERFTCRDPQLNARVCQSSPSRPRVLPLQRACRKQAVQQPHHDWSCCLRESLGSSARGCGGAIRISKTFRGVGEPCAAFGCSGRRPMGGVVALRTRALRSGRFVVRTRPGFHVKRDTASGPRSRMQLASWKPHDSAVDAFATLAGS